VRFPVSYRLGSVRAAFTIFTLAAATCACRTHKPEGLIPPGALAVVCGDCRRERDPGFSGNEQALIGNARRYFEKVERRKFDAYYRVRRTFDGNEIIAMYVSGYEGNEPIFSGWCTVLMGDDGSVIQVFRPPK